MKPLVISLSFATLAFGGIVAAKKKPIGPCEPYAETCRHCTDCSQCKHCAGLGGKCSVCFKR